MSTRLIIEVIQTALEETAIAAVGLLGLPRIGVHIPLPAVAVIMFAWLAYSVFSYLKATEVLLRKSMFDISGAEGIVVETLDPEGMIKIQGELWTARANERIESGEEVVVIAKEGKRLIVVRAGKP